MKTTFSELKLRARRSLYGNYGSLAALQLLLAVVGYTVLMCLYFVVFMMMLVGMYTVFGVRFEAMIIFTLFALLFLLYFGFIFVAALIGVGYTKIHMDLAQARPFQGMNIFYAFRHKWWRFAGAFLLLFVISMLIMTPLMIFDLWRPFGVPVSLILSFLLYLLTYIVLFWFSMSFALIYYLMIDNPDMKVFAAFRESYAMMKGNRLRLLGLGFSFIGWMLLGYLTMGIGFIWIFPYIMCTAAHFYLDLKERKRIRMMEAQEMEP